MSTLTIYSSWPLPTPLAVACLNLGALGQHIQFKPLSELPPGPSPARQRARVYADLVQVSTQLACLGEQLSDHELGRHRLGAGEEQGLRALRDSLAARRRGLLGTLRGLGDG